MKKIFAALIIVALLLCMMILVACGDEGHVHSFEDVTVKPTCSTKGYVEHTCLDCGYTCQDTFTDADSKTHVYGAAVTVKEATCSQKGLNKSTCIYCGDVKETTVSTLKHIDDVVVTVEPTCTGKGKATYTCTVCGRVEANKDVVATGHKYSDWVVDVEPDCATEAYGHKYRDCSACGNREEQDIPSHNADKTKTVVTKPTCVSVGYTTYVCADCGTTYVRDYKEATGKHSFGSWYNVEGYNNLQRRDCKDCDHYEIKETK